MKKLFATALAAVVVAAQSQAIWVYWAGGSDPGSYTSGTYKVTYASTTTTVTAGLLGVYLGINPAQAQSKTFSWWAYCLSPLDVIGTPQNPWEANSVALPGSLVGGDANKAAWLANILFDSTIFPQQYKYPFAAQHAKVQLALWDLMGATITDTANNPIAIWDDAGKTQITLGSTQYTYNSSTTYGYVYLDPVNPGQGQRLLQGGRGGGQNYPVPEPVTMGFAALGLAAALRKRRNR
ncbi:MAG: hypothetical protein WHU10_10000 [Fimbriimonadales bacterium]